MSAQEIDPRYPRVSQGRRMVGVLIDWLMSYAIAIGFFVEFGEPAMGAVVFLIFTIQYLIFTVFGGSTPGHRIMGLKIVRFSDGGMPTPIQALIRTGLLILIITAITFDQNGRGINERLSNTVLVKTR
jgi:uncharacterized RDD family membrane protein YckC